jgi:AbrB family looped-hinge helix DNA binding protein
MLLPLIQTYKQLSSFDLVVWDGRAFCFVAFRHERQFLVLTFMYIFAIQVVSMQTSTPHTHPRTPLSHLLIVARKGQITIPAPIRDALHIKEGDTVAVELQGGEVKITPVPYLLL